MRQIPLIVAFICVVACQPRPTGGSVTNGSDVKAASTATSPMVIPQTLTANDIVTASDIGIWKDGYSARSTLVVKSSALEVARIPCSVKAPDEFDLTYWKIDKSDAFYTSVTTCRAQIDLSVMTATSPAHAFGAFSYGKFAGSFDCALANGSVSCVEHVNASLESAPREPLVEVTSALNENGLHGITMKRSHNSRPLIDMVLTNGMACKGGVANTIGAMATCTTGSLRVAFDTRNIDDVKDVPAFLDLGSAKVPLICKYKTSRPNTETAQYVSCRVTSSAP